MHKVDFRRVHVRMKTNSAATKILQYLHKHGVQVYMLRTEQDFYQFEVARKNVHHIKRARRMHRTTIRLHYTTPTALLPKTWLTACFLLCLWLIPFFLNEWIWDMRVEDATPEQTFAIEQLLKEHMQTPMLKKDLPSDQAIRQMIMERFREFSWVHVAKVGSEITIRPQLAPINKSKQQKIGNNHLVASSNGVVTHFDLQSGERQVTPNTTVYSGDLLVSGVMTVGEKHMIIGAVGEVYADYWFESDFTLPQKIKYEVVTASDWRITFLKHPEEKGLRKVNLPTWLAPYIEINEIQTTEEKIITLNEAHIETLIMPLLHEKMVQSLHSKGIIKNESLLHIKFQDGKVKGKVLYLINENIAKPYPIE